MAAPLFCDAHLHLQDSRYSGERAGIIARAVHSGVGSMLCNGVCEEDWQQVLDIAGQHPEVAPFLGVHPWYAGGVAPGWDARLALLLQSCGCGIGETGLDRNCGVDRQQQVEVFLTQLELAAGFARPLVIHCVRCWGQLIDLLTERAASEELPLIMIHSFGGSLETMQRLTGLGCYLSFSAKMMHRSGDKIGRVFAVTPLERILLETDAPDQLYGTVAGAGKHPYNEPALVGRLYRYAARLRAMDFDAFCTAVWNNAAVFTGTAAAR